MTNEQNVIAANAAYIEELIRDVDRIEKSRDYVTNEMNRECNKLVAAEKELQEADESIRFAIYQLEDIQDAIDDIKEALKLDVIVTDDEAD